MNDEDIKRLVAEAVDLALGEDEEEEEEEEVEEPQQLPDKPKCGLFQSHHVLRHMISGVITLCAAISIETAINQYLLREQHKVRWTRLGNVEDFVRTNHNLVFTNQVELGLRGDGTMVWRLP